VPVWEVTITQTSVNQCYLVAIRRGQNVMFCSATPRRIVQQR